MRFFCNLIICLSIASSSDLQAQNFGVVCTYDYRQTLHNNDINSFDPAHIPPVSFLVASDVADSITLTQKNSFDEMMQGFASRKNLVLYVHGDHSRLSLLLSTGSEFAREYDVDYLIFVWPSNEIKSGSRKNYRNSKLNTLSVMPGFVETIESASEYCSKNGVKLTVLFHSLGNLLAKNFARYSIVESDFRPFQIDNIILNAACVDEHDHDIWVDILFKYTKGKIYITQNEGDAILSLVKTFIEKDNLLGMPPTSIKSEKATYVNFTDILSGCGGQESHGYFMGDIIKRKPQIKVFYQQIFDGLNLRE